MHSIYDIHISTILGQPKMTSETISTNTSRKSSVGSFSIESVGNDTEENTCRKSNVGSFSIISFNNDAEQDILQGTIKLNIFFLPFSVSTKMTFSTIFCDNFLPNDECLVGQNKISKKN